MATYSSSDLRDRDRERRTATLTRQERRRDKYGDLAHGGSHGRNSARTR